MIINGGSRMASYFFSRHLTNVEKNETVRLVDIQGLAAKNVHGCFREMQAVASGTRCKNFFYHAHLNPRYEERLTDAQWEQAIDLLEAELKLSGQSRFVVEHDKNGRVHRHVVWSRIDVEQMRAVRMDHDYEKHQKVARQLEREFGLEIGKSVLGPEKEGERPDRRPEGWETFRGKEKGLKVEDVKKEITGLWKGARDGEDFVSALQGRGYILTQGDSRNFVVVDRHGHSHSLARRVDGARARDIREKLADIDQAELPTVKEAQRQQAELRQEEEKRQEFLQKQEEDRQAHLKADEERRQQFFKEEEQRQARLLQEEEAKRQEALRQEQQRQEQQRLDQQRQEELRREQQMRAEAVRVQAYQEQLRKQQELAQEMQRREQAFREEQQRLEQFKAYMAAQTEKARQAFVREREMEGRTREREITNAGRRYGIACADHYDIRDPYQSLARSAMAEYGQFLREQQRLDQQIARARDPQERQRLELRQRIEAAEYMAITSDRIAGQSGVITGRTTEGELREKAKAQHFWEQAKALRKEYKEISVGREEQAPPQQAPVSDRQEQKKPVEGLRVEDRKPGSGGVGKSQALSDFVKTLPEKTPRRDFTAAELRNNVECRRQQLLQKTDDENRAKALDNIAGDMRRGRNLNTRDVQRLSREDVQGIKRDGDDYLKTLVQQHEKARQLEREKRRER